jgi:hypothetical protein
MKAAIAYAIFFGFTLRLLVAIWNGFFGPSFSADGDATFFHLDAVAVSKNPRFDEFRMGWVYSDALGWFYYFTTDSLFLGSLLSCIAWLVSALILQNLSLILSIERKFQTRIMLIYAFLPSSILMTSVTLREPYQMMFVNLAIYAALKIYLHKSAVYWLWLFAGCIGMGILHGALFVFGFFIVIGIILLNVLRGRNGISLSKLVPVVPFVLLILYYGLSLFTNVAYSLDTGLYDAVAVYQKNHLNADARTIYTDSIEIDSATSFLLFIPRAFFQYLFEPFPWNVSTIADVVVLFENILRAWLICKAWTGLRNMRVQVRRPVLFVFLSYFVIEFIWSLGTANWGTAVRHHLPSMGMLLLAAFAYAVNKSGLEVKSRAANSKVALI